MGPLKTGIVICTRLDSVRLPRKPFIEINGRCILDHLIHRLIPTKLPIVLAVPTFQFPMYQKFAQPNVTIFGGSHADPLHRMNQAAQVFGFETIVRVTHDKIFMEPRWIEKLLWTYAHSDLDYLYSSDFPDGSGFEVISGEALEQAAKLYNNVEHISYAIKCVTDRQTNVNVQCPTKRHRLLIDYPKDVIVMTEVLTQVGNNCTLDDALDFLDDHPEISRINKLPPLTIYTCAFNAEQWIEKCMGSVASQSGFSQYEYLIVDDGSTDKTLELVKKFCAKYHNTRYLSNTQNIGLSSSSNVALRKAKGEFILRLDADDYFVGPAVLEDMVKTMEANVFDVIYPDYYHGSNTHIEKGNVEHHVGGAMFRTRAVNHVMFTDKLRGFEGYDLFQRAKRKIKIGYYEKPVFFYRRHQGSLSQSDPAERAKIKESIDNKLSI